MTEVAAPVFKSPQELKRILQPLSLGLHARNRVAGESNFVWHMAEAIRAAALSRKYTEESVYAREWRRHHKTETVIA